jgi:2'-5' RNA ligase
VSEPEREVTFPAPREARDEGLRLFIGVKVSLATVNALSGAVEALARRANGAGVRVRWLAPATYHVTLRFLGWTRPEAVEALRDRLRAIAAERKPFELTTRRLSAFPKPASARVVWAGIEDATGQLAALAAELEKMAVELGYAPEARAFHGHVTIGRLKEPADVGTVLLPLAEQEFSRSRVDAVVLFESVTKAKGSEYTALATMRLEGGSKAAKRQTDTLERRAYDDSNDSDDGWGSTPRPPPSEDTEGDLDER